MRKWLLILVLGILFVFPPFASAQSDVTLSHVLVQLWPEYDQPSMLVITDFQMPTSAQLPAKLTFRIPQEGNLIAVATYAADGSLVNAVFDGPTIEGEWKVFTITMDTVSARFEYYQPLTINGNQREFSYLWSETYAVDAFDIRVLEPMDLTSFKTDPNLSSISQENGLTYHSGSTVKLASGEQFALNLQYNKTTDTLIAPPQGVQPSAPVGESTPGRVSLNNYLPYIIGGLGVIMIIGGIIYYWQAGRSQSRKPRRRSHTHPEDEDGDVESYCPQCGTRAKGGDRFCRVCGARLRHPEE